MEGFFDLPLDLIDTPDSFDKLSSENYEIVLDKISKNLLSVPVQNNDRAHAAKIMKFLFRETGTDLGFYVNRFSGTYSSDPEYLENLSSCLAKNIQVNVLLDNDPNHTSKAYSYIEDYIKNTGNGNVAIATDKAKEVIGHLFRESKPLHFAVSDDRRYRVEIDPESKAAYAHFNDPDMARNLRETLAEAMKYSYRIL